MRLANEPACFHLAKLLVVAVALLLGWAPRTGWGAADACPAPTTVPKTTKVNAPAAPKPGTMTAVLPPACETVVYRGMSYARCGEAWYRPRYTGFAVTYIVVKPPC